MRPVEIVRGAPPNDLVRIAGEHRDLFGGERRD
jgi:hypothetical protein